MKKNQREHHLCTKNVKKSKNEENWLTTSNAKSYKLTNIANIFS